MNNLVVSFCFRWMEEEGGATSFQHSVFPFLPKTKQISAICLAPDDVLYLAFPSFALPCFTFPPFAFFFIDIFPFYALVYVLFGNKYLHL